MGIVVEAESSGTPGPCPFFGFMEMDLEMVLRVLTGFPR